MGRRSKSSPEKWVLGSPRICLTLGSVLSAGSLRRAGLRKLLLGLGGGVKSAFAFALARLDLFFSFLGAFQGFLSGILA